MFWFTSFNHSLRHALSSAVSLSSSYRSFIALSILLSRWHDKGIALSFLGKDNEALEAYDKAIPIDPNDVDTWHEKGLSLKKLGKDKDANKCFDKAKQLTKKAKLLQKTWEIKFSSSSLIAKYL